MYGFYVCSIFLLLRLCLVEEKIEGKKRNGNWGLVGKRNFFFYIIQLNNCASLWIFYIETEIGPLQDKWELG